MDNPVDVTKSPTRRSFLNYLISFSFIGLIGSFIYPLIKYMWPPSSGIGSGGSQNLFIPLSEINPGQAKTVSFQNQPIVIIRTSNEIKVLSAVCTHLGCIVKWNESQGKLICPCHAAIFDTNGNVLGGPAPRPLPPLPAKIVGDKIMIG